MQEATSYTLTSRKPPSAVVAASYSHNKTPTAKYLFLYYHRDDQLSGDDEAALARETLTMAAQIVEDDLRCGPVFYFRSSAPLANPKNRNPGRLAWKTESLLLGKRRFVALASDVLNLKYLTRTSIGLQGIFCDLQAESCQTSHQNFTQLTHWGFDVVAMQKYTKC